MKESIKQIASMNELFIPERCYITEVSNSHDDPEVSIARARVEPGVTTCWHRLVNISERYCIISGTGRVEIGTLPPEEVYPGDIVIIPPMCQQRITNIGLDDLVFLAICTPPFSNDAYEDIEGTPKNKI